MAHDARPTGRQWCGLNLAPLPLRLVLALVFILAGLGKILADITVEGPLADAVRTVWGDPNPPSQPSNTGGSGDRAASGQPVTVRGVKLLAASLYMAGHPQADAGAAAPKRIWPKTLSGPFMAKAQAWAVTITEILAGVFLLIGLMTRLSAAAIVGVMVGAVWLTQIGPAMQSGQTFLGILPDHPRFAAEWQTMYLQLSMMAMAMAVMFIGAGFLSLDSIIFRPRPLFDEESE